MTRICNSSPPSPTVATVSHSSKLAVTVEWKSKSRLARAPAVALRETDVLRRISVGESNKEVARALDLSPSTVRTHIESVFRKLECSTRAAATLKAFTLGLL